MEGSIAVPDGNCEGEHRHEKCTKYFANLEKTFPQPPIDEKHKQRNQEILERKRKVSNAGRKISQRVSDLESQQMAGKFALERQQQKKVEVFDSHAIDITQYKDTDTSETFLPRHLKKRQTSQALLSVNKTKTENIFGQNQGTADHEVEDIDDEEGLEILRNVEELRRASLAYGILGPQRTSPQHDTLRAYFKFQRENMAKEDRLKKVQAKAKVRETEDEAVYSSSMSQRNSHTILPPLNKKSSFQNNQEAKIKEVHNKERINIGRHAKLPKIARRKNKVKEAKEAMIGRDPRFQKLISCLVPMSDKSGVSHSLIRKRHYTM